MQGTTTCPSACPTTTTCNIQGTDFNIQGSECPTCPDIVDTTACEIGGSSYMVQGNSCPPTPPQGPSVEPGLVAIVARGANYSIYDTKKVQIITSSEVANTDSLGYTGNYYHIICYGFFRAPSTGTYSFRTRIDDHLRLIIGGTVIAERRGANNAWVDSTVTKPMVGGQYYPIQLFAYEISGYSYFGFQYKVGSADYKKADTTELFHAVPIKVY